MRPTRLLAACSLALLVASLFTSGPAFASGRCYVDAASTSGGNTGTSWSNAYLDLQSALTNLLCTEVWVAQGTYHPTTTGNRAVSFVLRNGVKVYGGFAGDETQLAQRDFMAHRTLLSGAITSTDQSYHVVDASNTGRTAVLDGFEIHDGLADGSGNDIHGAGMYISSGSPTLRNLLFVENVSFSAGGAIFSINGSPSLFRVAFERNQAQVGGAMAIYGGSPILKSISFLDNAAVYSGGGLHSELSTPRLTNVTFVQNTAGSIGGGILNGNENSLQLFNVTFAWNGAGQGGAIYNHSGSHITLKNSILHGDTGGEIFSDGTSTTTAVYSIIQLPGPGDVFPGQGNLNVDPLFIFPSWDGWTITMPVLLGSPALDAGTGTGCPATDQRGIPRPQPGSFGGTARCDMGSAEARAIHKTFKSLGSQDGWMLEASEDSNTMGLMNTGSTTLRVGDDASDRQYRSILSFNTASLPEWGGVQDATLKFRLQGITGGSLFKVPPATMRVETIGSNIGPSASLTVEDFDASLWHVVDFTSPATRPGGWYSVNLYPVLINYINTGGVTQYRLRFVLDDDDDQQADFLRIFSGNAASADRPKLIVKYFAP